LGHPAIRDHRMQGVRQGSARTLRRRAVDNPRPARRPGRDRITGRGSRPRGTGRSAGRTCHTAPDWTAEDQGWSVGPGAAPRPARATGAIGAGVKPASGRRPFRPARAPRRSTPSGLLPSCCRPRSRLDEKAPRPLGGRLTRASSEGRKFRQGRSASPLSPPRLSQGPDFQRKPGGGGPGPGRFARCAARGRRACPSTDTAGQVFLCTGRPGNSAPGSIRIAPPAPWHRPGKQGIQVVTQVRRLEGAAQ